MIKGRSPFPFDTICLALTFSPGLSSLVKETRRLCDLHGSTAIFVHAGKKTSDKQRELSTLLSASGFNDTNSRIYWEPGDVVSSILRICKHEVVDLLIIGASERDEFKLPAGRTAIAIATRAKCSVLVYTGKPTGAFHNIVINGTEHKKTDLTILTTIYFSQKEKIDAIKIVDEFDSEYAGSGVYPETTETRTLAIANAIERSRVKLNFISLAKENCKSVAEFAFKDNADLLVTYSSDHHLLIFDRISSANSIEKLLSETPCSMLVVHSRIRD